MTSPDADGVGATPADEDAAVAAAKGRMREALVAARRARSAEDRRAAAVANGRHLLDALRGHAVVAAYLPLPSEPLAADLLDALAGRGARVLLPVVRGPEPLDWVDHPSPTRPAALGIAEPTGPRLGPAAIRAVTAVLVPALAVDRAGHRLGRGGGHYDRTLALMGDGPDRIAVLFDGELVDDVPTDLFDERVTAAVVPSAGLVALPRP